MLEYRDDGLLAAALLRPNLAHEQFTVETAQLRFDRLQLFGRRLVLLLVGDQLEIVAQIALLVLNKNKNAQVFKTEQQDNQIRKERSRFGTH